MQRVLADCPVLTRIVHRLIILTVDLRIVIRALDERKRTGVDGSEARYHRPYA
jgi:hypothetical protein